MDGVEVEQGANMAASVVAKGSILTVPVVSATSFPFCTAGKGGKSAVI